MAFLMSPEGNRYYRTQLEKFREELNALPGHTKSSHEMSDKLNHLIALMKPHIQTQLSHMELEQNALSRFFTIVSSHVRIEVKGSRFITHNVQPESSLPDLANYFHDGIQTDKMLLEAIRFYGGGLDGQMEFINRSIALLDEAHSYWIRINDWINHSSPALKKEIADLKASISNDEAILHNILSWLNYAE